MILQVKHSIEEFSALSDALRTAEISSNENFPTLPADLASTVEVQVLQDYLTSVIEQLKENIWHKEVFIKFLDEAPNKSYLTQVQLSKMSKQVSDIVR